MKLDDLSRFIERLPFASIDHLRPVTQGHQEVILCQGKPPAKVVAIAGRLAAASGRFLATRSEPAHRAALAARFPRAEVNELGRTVYLSPDPEPAATGRGTVLIVTAGTSDLPVAEEAAVTARALGNRVERLPDVGVAGIHRVLTQTDALRSAAVVPAVLAANLWALVAAVGGFLAAPGLVLAPLVRVWLAEQPITRPSDFEHLLDLLRRAHRARAGWLVGLAAGDVEAVGNHDVSREVRQRGAAVVQLASVDGRAHVARESEGSYVAVGDFPFGAGLLLPGPDVDPRIAEAIASELRRLVAGMRVAELHEPDEQAGQLVAKQLAAIAAGSRTLDGIAKAGAELAQQLARRGVAIVLHGAGGWGGGTAARGARSGAPSGGAAARLANLP